MSIKHCVMFKSPPNENYFLALNILNLKMIPAYPFSTKSHNISESVVPNFCNYEK